MAYVKEVVGECGDAGCTRPVRLGLFDQHGVLTGTFCKLCAYRRLALLEKIEQRSASIKKEPEKAREHRPPGIISIRDIRFLELTSVQAGPRSSPQILRGKRKRCLVWDPVELHKNLKLLGLDKASVFNNALDKRG